MDVVNGFSGALRVADYWLPVHIDAEHNIRPLGPVSASQRVVIEVAAAFADAQQIGFRGAVQLNDRSIYTIVQLNDRFWYAAEVLPDAIEFLTECNEKKMGTQTPEQAEMVARHFAVAENCYFLGFLGMQLIETQSIHRFYSIYRAGDYAAINGIYGAALGCRLRQRGR